MNLREIDGVTWCPVDECIPGLDILQTRLEYGCKIKKQKTGEIDVVTGCMRYQWHLFDSMGESVVSGDSLRNIIVNLIFLDC